MNWPWIRRQKKEVRYSITDPFYLSGVNYFIESEIDSIVQSAIQFYCNPIKELPLCIHDGTGRKVMAHPLFSLLVKPSPFHSRATFFSRLLRNYLLYGESFCLIQGGAIPTELYLYWQRGDMYAFHTGKQGSPDQKFFYRSRDRTYMGEDIIHIREDRGFEYRGEPRAKTMSEVISALKQKTINQIKGFQTKGFLTGIHDTKSKAKVKEFQADLRKFLSDDSGFKILTMPTGQELKSFTPDLKPEAFISLKKVLTREIYSLFGVPQVLAGDTDRPASTYKALSESLAIFVRTHLSPTLSVIESEFSEKLLTQKELVNGFRIQFDFENLLRGDSETMYKNLSLASGQRPFLTPNDIRAKLNLPPVPEGDRLPDTETAQ